MIDKQKNNPQSESARPTTLATASTWIGWKRNNKAANLAPNI